MSMRAVFSASARRSILRPTSAWTSNSVRTFGSTAVRAAGKEDALNKEGRDEEIEHHKHDSLRKQKDGQGHWKDELSSNSESIIKAERGEVEASDETIKKLQEDSVNLQQKKQ